MREKPEAGGYAALLSSRENVYMFPGMEIAESEGIDERTVYKDIKAACTKLAALLFGIDGVKRT